MSAPFRNGKPVVWDNPSVSKIHENGHFPAASGSFWIPALKSSVLRITDRLAYPNGKCIFGKEEGSLRSGELIFLATLCLPRSLPPTFWLWNANLEARKDLENTVKGKPIEP